MSRFVIDKVSQCAITFWCTEFEAGHRLLDWVDEQAKERGVDVVKMERVFLDSPKKSFVVQSLSQPVLFRLMSDFLSLGETFNGFRFENVASCSSVVRAKN